MAMPSHPLPVPRPGWLVYRPVVIAVRAAVLPGTAALTGLAVTATRGRKAGQRCAYRGFVRLLQRLGPALVKFGQIMSTRRDALPGGCAASSQSLRRGPADDLGSNAPGSSPAAMEAVRRDHYRKRRRSPADRRS